jgi:hypothetical protein
METWIVADDAALMSHYGASLQRNALPSQTNLETITRGDVQYKLEHATRNSSNAYRKGRRSYIILGKLNPETLETHLPSFARAKRILRNVLQP